MGPPFDARSEASGSLMQKRFSKIRCGAFTAWTTISRHFLKCQMWTALSQLTSVHAIQANGLLTSNSWAGYHVLLNPEYSGSTQWRFVNRAIDEVENDRVCSLLLYRLPSHSLCHRCVTSIGLIHLSSPLMMGNQPMSGPTRLIWFSILQTAAQS